MFGTTTVSRRSNVRRTANVFGTNVGGGGANLIIFLAVFIIALAFAFDFF